jgi:hypothetical protein
MVDQVDERHLLFLIIQILSFLVYATSTCLRLCNQGGFYFFEHAMPFSIHQKWNNPVFQLKLHTTEIK